MTEGGPGLAEKPDAAPAPEAVPPAAPVTLASKLKGDPVLELERGLVQLEAGCVMRSSEPLIEKVAARPRSHATCRGELEVVYLVLPVMAKGG